MKKVIVIPARLNSSRLPKKVLLDLSGKTILQRVYEQCNKLSNVKTFIATDSKLIKHESLKFTQNVIMTKSTHESGTDRVVEAVSKIDCDLIVNVQGDEPFINPNTIKKLFESIQNKNVSMSSVCERINEKDQLISENSVKVVLDENDNAIYFSRSVIPCVRDGIQTIFDKNGKIYSKYNFYKHVGIYGYTKDFLKVYSKIKKSELEKLEKLEQLRVLQSGIKIKMIKTKNKSFGIDTIKDYKNAKKIIRNEKFF